MQCFGPVGEVGDDGWGKNDFDDSIRNWGVPVRRLMEMDPVMIFYTLSSVLH